MFRSIFRIVNKNQTKMSSLYIGLLVLCFIVICQSLPVDRTEMEYVRNSNKINKIFDGFVSETVHNIARRSKRSGIISGHLCPTGYGKLYGTGDCVRCNGRRLLGCPEVPDDPNYDDE